MIRCIAFLLSLILLGSPAWALSPSYSGGGSGEGAGQFIASAVNGAGAAFNVAANELVRVPVFVEVTSGSAPAIVKVSNDVTPLAWHRRAAKTGTVAQSGGVASGCNGNFELWEAYSPTAITATHVSVTIASAADSTLWYVNRYANTFGAMRPSDGNTGLPVAITNNAGGIAPTATIPATTQSDDLVVGYTAYCASALANVAGSGFVANNSFQQGASFNWNTGGAVSKSVASPQSSLAVPFGNVPASPAGFFFIADALTNDVPPAKLQATSSTVATGISVTGGGASVCNSPSVPAPAAAAGFTTLAYCADFTTDAGTNNVKNGTPQNTVWTNVSSWFDCSNTGTLPNGQWVNQTIGFAATNPCANKTVANDPAVSQNALIMTALPGDGAEILSLATAINPCADTSRPCYLVFPVMNLYAEIHWRYDYPAISSFITSPGNVVFDFWSWYSDGNGCAEVDFIEIFSWSPIGPGYANQGCTGTITTHHSAFSLNNSYHTDGTLSTTNRTTLATMCEYHDGVASQPSGTCSTYTGTTSNITFDQEGYLILWNTAGWPTAVSANVPLYIAWIRVWSCAGWLVGTPRTASNTCSVASPFTTAP